MPHFTFRPLVESDLDAFHDMINDPTLARMAGSIPSPVSTAVALERIIEKDEHGLFDQSGTLLGSGSLFVRPDRPRQWEVGYAVHRDQRGKGYATKLLTLLIEQARTRGVEGGLHAGVAQDNPASRHILEKAGFQYTGDDVFTSLGRGGEVQGWRFWLSL